MTDVIKINLHNRDADPVLWAEAEAFQGEPGKAYVFAHGTPDAIADDRRAKGAAKLTALCNPPIFSYS